MKKIFTKIGKAIKKFFSKFIQIIKKKWLISGTKTVILFAIIIALFILVNYGMEALDLTPIDLTKEKLYSLTDDSKEKIKNIDKDVKISDQELSKIIEQLQKINSIYGNYYVNGNHDLKFDKFYEMFDTANFINLNDNYDVIYNKSNEAIFLSGLSTSKKIDFLDSAFENSNYAYKINIMHYPDYFDNIKNYNFNLVLAGHSHNGQVRIPFYGAVVTPLYAKNYYKPYYKIGNTNFYISSGIGTSSYDFRLFNRPSFNLYRLNNIK